ncbi:hypothetical protein IFR05_008196 [Cadophora sp. M221]|nr:hypothetical protein IFR05_008196 [Cadophora sp. M221]
MAGENEHIESDRNIYTDGEGGTGDGFDQFQTGKLDVKIFQNYLIVRNAFENRWGGLSLNHRAMCDLQSSCLAGTPLEETSVGRCFGSLHRSLEDTKATKEGTHQDRITDERLDEPPVNMDEIQKSLVDSSQPEGQPVRDHLHGEDVNHQAETPLPDPAILKSLPDEVEVTQGTKRPLTWADERLENMFSSRALQIASLGPEELLEALRGSL